MSATVVWNRLVRGMQARALRAYRVAGSKRCPRCKNSLQRNSIGSLNRLCDRPQVTSVRNGYTEGSIEGREREMKKQEVTLPELALIAGTRGMLGAGIGLLLSGKLSKDQRRAAGWTLVAVGAVTTIPLLMSVFGNHNR